MQQTGTCSLLWEFQCLGRQGSSGGEGVCNGSPAPWAPLNSHASFPRQTTLPLGAFPAMEPLTPVPLGCLCIANSGPLPGSTILTPPFRTQPPPALASCCLRLEHSGLILEEALVWAVHAGPVCGQRRLWWWQHSGPWSLRQRRRPWLEGRAICLEYLPPALYFEPMFIFRAEMSLLEATYSWVLDFNSSSYSVSFDR